MSKSMKNVTMPKQSKPTPAGVIQKPMNSTVAQKSESFRTQQKPHAVTNKRKMPIMAGGAGPTGNISKKQKTGTKLSDSNRPIFPEVLDGLNKYLLNLETTSTNERSSMKNPDSPEDEKTGKVRFFKFRMSSKIAKLAEELHRPSFRVLLENCRRTFSAQLDDNYSVSNLRQTLLNNIEPGPPPDCQDQNVSDSAFSEIYAEISNS
eukprot:41864_1